MKKRVTALGLTGLLLLVMIVGLGPVRAEGADPVYQGDEVTVVYPDGNVVIGGENTFSTHRFSTEDGTPVYCGYYKGGSGDGVATTSKGILTDNTDLYRDYTGYRTYDPYWLYCMDYIVMHGYKEVGQGGLSFTYEGTAVPSLTGRTVTLTDPHHMWIVTQYALWWCELLGRDQQPTGWSDSTYYYSGCFNTFGNPGECYPAYWAQIYAAHYQLVKEAMTYVDTYGAAGVSREVILLEPVKKEAEDGLHSIMQAFIMWGGDQTPPPKEGILSLKKTSSRLEITKGNSCYRLTGTTYGVFADEALKTRVGTLTVQDESGVSNELVLTEGTYYVREETAGYGYELDPATHRVEIRAEQTTQLKVKETPGNDPGVITITKEADYEASYGYDLSGTQFELSYYAAYYDSVEEARAHQADKTFVIQTKELEEGLFAASFNESYLVKALSDEPYYNASGTRIVLPLGTLIISERTPAKGFLKDCVFTDSLGNTYEEAYLAQIRPSGGSFVLTCQNGLAVEEGGFLAKDTPDLKEVTIQKQDEETGPLAQGEALLEAKFSIYALEPIQGTTLKKGDLVVENLSQGESVSLMPGAYEVRETACHEGYCLKEEPLKIQVTDEENQTFVFTNRVKKKPIMIIKHLGSASGRDQAEEGAEFTITLKATGETVAVLTTDSQGKAVSEPLPYGTYVLTQTKGTEHYQLSEDITITISEDSGEPLVYSLTNQPHTAYLKIVKKDALTGKVIAMAGTSFKITDQKGEEVKQILYYPSYQEITTFVTDETGTVQLQEPLLAGDYTLTEVQAPAGYLPTEPISFTIPDDYTETIFTLEVENQPVMGQLRVIKTGPVLTGYTETASAYGTVYTPVFEEKPVSGVRFVIYAKEDIVQNQEVIYQKGEEIATIVTSGQEEGDTTELLPLGTYLVQEVSAPGEYVLDKENLPAKEVVLEEGNEAKEVVEATATFHNDYKKTTVFLKKEAEIPTLEKEEETGEVRLVKVVGPGEGFVFGLYEQETDRLFGIAPSNAAGQVVFSLCLPEGEYYVKELGGPAGYLLSEEKIPVSVTMEGETGVVIDLSADPILNEWQEEPVMGGIRVEKWGGFFVSIEEETSVYGTLHLPVFEDRYLSGAVFEIKASEEIQVFGETAYEVGELVDVLTTDDTGAALSKPLFPGVYEVREVKAPAGFVLDETTYLVTVKGEEVSTFTPQLLSVTDEAKSTRILLSKVLETKEGMKKAKGIVFGLYAGEDLTSLEGEVLKKDDLIALAESDEEGRVTFSLLLPQGKYYVKELKTLEGYELLQDPIQIDLTEGAEGEEEYLLDLTQTNIVNHPIPEKEEGPGTGDTAHPVKYLVLGCVSLLLFGGLLLWLFLRRQRG